MKVSCKLETPRRLGHGEQDELARKLYVRDVDQTWDKHILQEKFREYLKDIDHPGPKVLHTYIVGDKASGWQHRYGFVLFATEQLATAALGLSGSLLNGVELKLERPKGYMPSPCHHAIRPLRASCFAHPGTMDSQVRNPGSIGKDFATAMIKEFAESEGQSHQMNDSLASVSAARSPTLGVWGNNALEHEEIATSGAENDAASVISVAQHSGGMERMDHLEDSSTVARMEPKTELASKSEASLDAVREDFAALDCQMPGTQRIGNMGGHASAEAWRFGDSSKHVQGSEPQMQQQHQTPQQPIAFEGGWETASFTEKGTPFMPSFNHGILTPPGSTMHVTPSVHIEELDRPIPEQAVVSALVESINAVENIFWEVLWPDLHSKGWIMQPMGRGNMFIPPPIQQHLLPTTTSVQEAGEVCAYAGQDFLRYLCEHPHLLQRAPSSSGEAPNMHEAIHNLARARNTLPKSTFGAGKPAQPPFHRSQEPPSQSAPAQPFIGAMDPPKGSAAKDAPFYAAKAPEDFITPPKLPKVLGHDLSPPSVEGAEPKKTRTGRGPFSPLQEKDENGNAEGKD